MQTILEHSFTSNDPTEKKQNISVDAGTDPVNRQKVVWDGFSMPYKDYQLIEEIYAELLSVGMAVTKSGILRAGLHALMQLPKEARLRIFDELDPIKTGRPSSKKSKN